MIEENVHTTRQNFEQLYISLRAKEGRIYTDEQLLQLPEIEKGHPHFAEWQLRKESYLRLENYLKKKVFPMKILEVGCGNGWLSHRLSYLPDVLVAGVDINRSELKQAEKVFGNRRNLQFIYGGIDTVDLIEFDQVIFASSIQYFPSLKEIIDTAMQKLKPGGDIHILDTHFYKKGEIKAAQQRTKDHFAELGFPGLSAFYFHHSLDELGSFGHTIKYEPSIFKQPFNNNKNPFRWICIRKA